MVSKGNYVNGVWKKATGKALCSYSANDDSIIWEGFSSSAEDITECVMIAEAAKTAWAEKTVDERISYIQRFVDIVKRNKEKLAKTISSEIGKPLWEALTEVNSVIGKLDLTVSAYEARCKDLVREMNNGGISRTQFKPLGVVAVVGPYNFPCHMANGHIMPALIAGNTVIFKPSEKGAMSAEIMMEYWEEACLPNGVINMVQGEGEIGNLLVSSENIDGVFFTGSYEVGEKIRQRCSTEKMCVLEMGGNSPLVIWDSDNIETAVIATIQSAFITSGQRCSAARRLIVPNNSFGDQFIKKLVALADNIIVGKYDDEVEPFMGPVRFPSLVDTIIEEQDRLVKSGAVILKKCERLPQGKCFVSPGIIDITHVFERNDDEIIGPFLRVVRVDTFEEAIEEANKSSYGLAAGIFTEERSLYDKFSSQIKAGLVNWNQQLTGASGWAPFGGVKKSGNYRPSGFFSVDYCVYAVASIEIEKTKVVENLPKGIRTLSE